MKQKTQGRELSTLVPASFVFSESWFGYFVSLILYSKINGFAQQPTFWVMSGVKYGKCRMTFICPIRACHSFFYALSPPLRSFSSGQGRGRMLLRGSSLYAILHAARMRTVIRAERKRGRYPLERKHETSGGCDLCFYGNRHSICLPDAGKIRHRRPCREPYPVGALSAAFRPVGLFP